MNRRALSLVMWMAVVAVAMPRSRATAQPTADAQETSCRTTVQAFYDWYVPTARDEKRRRRNEPPDMTALRTRPSLFDPTLARLLRADVAAQSRSPDEIVGLDEDPFVRAQEFAAAYRVGNVKVSGEQCRATVVTSDPSIAAYTIVARLRRTKGGWMFVDFLDSDGGGIVDLLQTFARERRTKR